MKVDAIYWLAARSWIWLISRHVDHISCSSRHIRLLLMKGSSEGKSSMTLCRECGDILSRGVENSVLEVIVHVVATLEIDCGVRLLCWGVNTTGGVMTTTGWCLSGAAGWWGDVCQVVTQNLFQLVTWWLWTECRLRTPHWGERVVLTCNVDHIKVERGTWTNIYQHGIGLNDKFMELKIKLILHTKGRVQNCQWRTIFKNNLLFYNIAYNERIMQLYLRRMGCHLFSRLN